MGFPSLFVSMGARVGTIVTGLVSFNLGGCKDYLDTLWNMAMLESGGGMSWLDEPYCLMTVLYQFNDFKFHLICRSRYAREI
jgi:hypothetical protein